jgi:uncharacterized protein (DUF433 family)
LHASDHGRRRATPVESDALEHAFDILEGAMAKGVRDLWRIIVPDGGMRMKSIEVTDALLGVGLYSVTETAQILSQALALRVTAKSLRRWAYGRKRLVKEYAPIIQPTVRVEDAYLFTFQDVIELMTIAALRGEGMKMRSVKAAYERARELFGEHPFAKHKFSVDGAGIFPKGEDLEDLVTGRRAFQDIVAPLLRDIVTYLGDIPTELTPLGRDRTVLLNPARSFGSPINRATGIPTRILYAMHKAGEPIAHVAQWYNVSVEGVRDAVEYESALLNAA